MSLTRPAFVAFLAFVVAACSDAPTETSSGARSLAVGGPEMGVLHRYVAIGTSVSMGVQSDGVFEGTQRDSWPAQLTRLGGRELTQPYIAHPGCGAPLALALATGVRISGEPSAGVPDAARICAPLMEGVTLPTRNVAVDGARTSEALRRVPDFSDPSLRGRQYTRVLPAGHSQVSAAIAQNPKLVSVELGANELLGARSGIWLPGVTVVPTAAWKPDYVAVLDAVEATAKHVLVVGLINDAMDFPGFRTGAEIHAARATFLPLGIIVSDDCGGAFRDNVMFVAVRIPDAAGRARATGTPQTLSCVNAPSSTGIQDFVLSPAELGMLNAQLAEMNAFIAEQAEERGFAHFALEVLYGEVNVKGPLNAVTIMTSPMPYGPYISLDSFHPSAAGGAVLAAAAARALNERYGFRLPVSLQ